MQSEFQFLEKLRKKYRLDRIGDDCAVLPKDPKTDLVVTADLLVEEIDFRLDWTSPNFLGHKALAVSLSDIAAMGAKPVWAMLTIGVPEKIWKTDFVDRFYEGWFALARKYEVELVGGDVSRTPDKVVVDSIAAGEVAKGKAVLRSGAKPGDVICVTGELGGAAAALALLEKGERYGRSEFNNLLLRQLAPNPRTEIGQTLGELNLVSAMIDVSDGLSSDLRHLCRKSKIGAKIFASRIPVDSKLENSLLMTGDVPEPDNSDFKLQISNELFFALDGGEDFELLFTAPAKKIFDLENEFRNASFSRIGEATGNAEIIELISGDNFAILEPKGFRHF